MKKDWKILPFDDVISSSQIGIVRNNEEQSNEFTYRYLKMNNIRNDNGLNENSFSYIEASDEEVEKYSLKNDDFLFNTRNSYELVGKTCLYKSDYIAPTLFNNNILRVTFKKYLLPQFVAYAFSSARIIEELDKMKSGTTSVVGIYYKSLKNLQIPVPPLPEQQGIVAILDEVFEAIATTKVNAEQNLKNAKELFERTQSQIFKNLASTAVNVPLASVCDELFAGGDAPKDNFSNEKTEKYKIPIIANAVKDNGLYGYTDLCRVDKPCITVAARGSGTGHTEIRYEPFFPIVRLIVLIPNTNKITLEFLKFAIQDLEILSNGSAIPQLTIPMIKEYSIALPPITKQQTIVQKLDALSTETKRLEAIYQQKIADLEELKKSVLQKAFSGELTR